MACAAHHRGHARLGKSSEQRACHSYRSEVKDENGQVLKGHAAYFAALPFHNQVQITVRQVGRLPNVDHPPDIRHVIPRARFRNPPDRGRRERVS